MRNRKANKGVSMENTINLLLGGHWLPVLFAILMGVAILAYVILDGYDLGVGILTGATTTHKDMMIASIGPFWDANETWLVLGVGLLLVAFPMAHGVILTALYLPVAVMLIGLILRGVAFDFRVKARDKHVTLWNRAFFFGSLLTALSQGYMLGLYIVGFERTTQNMAFAALTGVCLAAGYCLIGAAWLIMKTEGELQKRSIRWAQRALWLSAVGIVAVSLATPLVSPRIFEKWFAWPNIVLLAPIPLLTGAVFLGLEIILRRLPKENDRHCWVPFVGSVFVFLFGFLGLGYSFYPYVVPDKITVWQAASAHESLMIILVGALFVLPFILGYTIYAYRVFWGKVRALSYI
jgi:cytochrome bd ubiquinol oxidase subunit II